MENLYAGSTGLQYVGQNIKRYRKTAKYTQKQLAEALGVAEVTMRQWENWNRVPPLDKILDISDLFNVDIRRLLFDSQLPPAIFRGETQSSMEHLRQMNAFWDLCHISNAQQIINAQNCLVQTEDDYIAEIAEDTASAASAYWSELLSAFPIDENENIIEKVHSIKPLVLSFLSLNKVGKEEAIKRVSELTEIARYTTKDGD